MFQKDLKKKMERIFGFKKTTFNTPSKEFEQDTLFVNIDQCKPRITQGKEIADVLGTLTIYSQHDKLPFGFIAKQLQLANKSDKEKLFFYDFEEDPAGSPARLVNISERRVRFRFLYEGQFDPNQGLMEGLQMEGCN